VGLGRLFGDLGTLLGGPIDGADLDTARRLVRTSSGVDRSIDLARRYIDEAVDVLAPFDGTPSAVALSGAATHLLVGVEEVLAA
jgi:geranylgeranyl pyrophosphate synthase